MKSQAISPRHKRSIRPLRLPRITRLNRRKTLSALAAPPAIRSHVNLLLSSLHSRFSERDIDQVLHAIEYGMEAHEGQQRASGEPYIVHPIQVAQILTEMHMDRPTIVAAILHDVLEDSETEKVELAREFGADVAHLVDGVSKLTQINFRDKAEAQAASLRKMILAMVDDLRVILIKLADRLHNMRTIDPLPRYKQQRIGRETLDIYAPLANRLGMDDIRRELEDLSFRAIHPLRYRVLHEHIVKHGGHRKDLMFKVGKALRKRLRQEGVKARVIGREKHTYGIYDKMRKNHLAARDIMDIYAFRVIVNQMPQCYQTLGVMHNLFTPIPGRFKDYIAIPKANGYQSLHTVLKSPYGVPIEIQIRTEDMDQVAQQGIAAHALYKARGRKDPAEQTRIREWTQRLLEMQQSAGDSIEFIDNVKKDLFPDEVYVFTPAGDIRNLPRGATVVDFAYAVHSGVGNSCIEARVDNKKVPLNARLMNGQTVHIVTDKLAHPNPNWLNFVVTGKARAQIRHFLKNLKRDQAGEIGRRMLELALENAGKLIHEIPEKRIRELLTELDLETQEDLWVEIGFGHQIAPLIVNQLVDGALPMHGQGDNGPLLIKGTEGTLVQLANCCRPVPGDPIVGYVTKGRGLVIHKAACTNISEPHRHSSKWLEVEWARDVKGEFPTEIKVEVTNQRGELARIAAEIATTGSNIENVNIRNNDGDTSGLTFIIQVRDAAHVDEILRHIAKLQHVMTARRV